MKNAKNFIIFSKNTQNAANLPHFMTFNLMIYTKQHYAIDFSAVIQVRLSTVNLSPLYKGLFMSYMPGFVEALEHAVKDYPRITIKNDGASSILDRIFVDGGTKHAYYVSYVQGQDSRIPESEWRSTLDVTYGSNEEYYNVLDLSHLPLNDIFKDVETLAFLAIRAVRQHIENDFQPLPGWGISDYRLQQLKVERAKKLNA